MAACSGTNFGSALALAKFDSSAAFRFEVPGRDCGKWCRNFKSAAPGWRIEMADNDFAEFKSALIVGAGSGLSAALARMLTRAGLNVTLASRTIDDLAALQHETGAQAFACDATREAEVATLFARLDKDNGAPDVVIYNA